MYYNGVHQTAVALFPNLRRSKKQFVQLAARAIEANSPAMMSTVRISHDSPAPCNKRDYLVSLLEGIFDQLSDIDVNG